MSQCGSRSSNPWHRAKYIPTTTANITYILNDPHRLGGTRWLPSEPFELAPPLENHNWRFMIPAEQKYWRKSDCQDTLTWWVAAFANCSSSRHSAWWSCFCAGSFFWKTTESLLGRTRSHCYHYRPRRLPRRRLVHRSQSRRLLRRGSVCNRSQQRGRRHYKLHSTKQ